MPYTNYWTANGTADCILYWIKRQTVNTISIEQDITYLSQITLNNGSFMTSILDLNMLTASEAGLYMCDVAVVDKHVQGTSSFNLTIKSKLENYVCNISILYY